MFSIDQKSEAGIGAAFCRIITLLSASCCDCDLGLQCEIRSAGPRDPAMGSRNKGELCLPSFHREHLRRAAPSEAVKRYSRRGRLQL
jgi:hypothetical protein